MFNRHMMSLARSSRGETQTELARALRVTQGTVSKYESGLSDPPDEFVNDLAKHLRYRPEFFYESGRPHGMPPFHYRKRKKVGMKALAKIVAEINIRRMHVEKLLNSYDFFPKENIPEIDPDEYVGRQRSPFSIESVATHLRDRWMVDRGPVPNMVDLIESIGGIVIPCDFGTDLIDAISQRIDGMPVMFFININSPADRMRHTLAHELAHMVLHTIMLVNDDEMEAQADEFAGAFLMPSEEIKPQLRNKFNLRQIANLKMFWKVSMQSIAMRASKLGLVTPYQSKMFFIELGKFGYRRREPYEPPKERPRLLKQMIEFHRQKLGYSDEELSTLLLVSTQELNELYSDDYFDPSSKPPSSIVQLHVVK